MVKKYSGKKKAKKSSKEVHSNKGESLKHLDSSQNENSKNSKKSKEDNIFPNLIPLRILDINSDGTKSGRFLFTIEHNSLLNTKKQILVLNSLSQFQKKFKIWLLTKFFKTLKELTVVNNIKKWCFQKLDIIEGYCNLQKIELIELNYDTKMRPDRIYKENNLKVFLDDFNLPRIFLKKKKIAKIKSYSVQNEFFKDGRVLKRNKRIERAEYLGYLLKKLNKLKDMENDNNLTMDQIKDQFEELQVYIKNYI